MKALKLFAVSSLLIGCVPDSREVILSPAFGVCASLANSEIYELNRAPIVDFDDGKLTTDGRKLNVYVGMNPDFPRNLRSVPKHSENVFTFSGIDIEGPSKKLLLAQRRADRKIVFVMISGASLSQDDVARLKKPRVVYQCSVTR